MAFVAAVGATLTATFILQISKSAKVYLTVVSLVDAGTYFSREAIYGTAARKYNGNNVHKDTTSKII